MSSRWERRGAPPTPPPRDPSGINSIVHQHQQATGRIGRGSFYAGGEAEEDMSSDSSSPPRAILDHKRRSSYENVSGNDDQGFCPNKPPPAFSSTPRRSREVSHRSTPSPRPHVRSSPCPSSSCGGGSRHASPVGAARQTADCWIDSLSDEPSNDPVRRRPASACRAPRSHRGSMPPVDFLGSTWAHRSACAPCCGPSPIPFHWCGAAQNWAHFSMHSICDSSPFSHRRCYLTMLLKRIQYSTPCVSRSKEFLCLEEKGSDPLYDCDDLQQKLCQLEADKEQLSLQVNVLSEQIEAQNEKIIELENSLSQRREQLNNAEALLRQEMSSRSSIENNKLDLMAQISALRLRLASVEQEKQELLERNAKLENELILTSASLVEKEVDLNFCQNNCKSKSERGSSENNPEAEKLDKLKAALKSVMAANDEKEKKLEEMKATLNRYKKLHELVLSNPTRRASDGIQKKVPLIDENLLSVQDYITSCNIDEINELSFDYNLVDKPPPVPRQGQQSLPPLSLNDDFHRSSSRLGEISRLSPFSPIRGESPSFYSSLNTQKYSSSENVSPPTPQKTPPAKRHYSTLPRPHGSDILQQYVKSPNDSTSPVAIHSGQTSQSFHNLHHPNYEPFRPTRTKASSGLSFGKGFFKIRLGKRSSSAPELAPDRVEEMNENPKNIETSYRRTSSPITALPPKEKSKGFRKIFGKVKRTGSENLNSSEAEFKRGGIRATAGPRLGWTNGTKNDNFKVEKPFMEWNSSMICDWLFSIGLGMYVSECKKWVKNGDQLLKATTSDFEKELGIKNMLHRKKLLLAVSGAKEQTGDIVEPAGKIDHQWVVRWLDDIGLPQYKDAFFDARIDGRMLHHLTLEDLSLLKVTNLLHHISIKTGIQVLRENNFNPHCLKRRSLPDDENTPSDVSRWTNHRVMEWLRTVDLSEYAPNLRGSGVHGGLMVYEPRFNADFLATLLNIPPNKTLLRRHLSTQFKQLIGADVMQKKRDWEAQPNHTPLSPSAKVKAVRRSHFSLMKKKNKNEFALEDYVCPMNFSEKMFGSMILSNGTQNCTEEEKFLMKEMVLKNDKILESMPASNV